MRRALWIVAPLCVLVVAAAAVYTTPVGQDWLETLQSGRPQSSDQSADPSSEQPSPSASPAGPAPQALPTPTAPAALPTVAPGDPDPQLIERALAPGLADKALGKHVVASVAPLESGAELFRSGEGAVVPASTMKLLTATAALKSLGPDHTFQTKVVLEARSGPGARTLVLVGGGDPLLARKPSDAYPERADVRTLAKETAAALKAEGVRRVRMSYDTSLFTGPPGSPQWRSDYLPDDIVAPITALWVDEGREPSGFGRVDDPAAVAATTFASALTRAGILVVGVPQEAKAASSRRGDRGRRLRTASADRRARARGQ